MPASLQRQSSGEAADSDASLLLGLGSAYTPSAAGLNNMVSNERQIDLSFEANTV
jgi:hypothetical protein